MGIVLLDSRDIMSLPAYEAILRIKYSTGTPEFIRKSFAS